MAKITEQDNTDQSVTDEVETDSTIQIDESLLIKAQGMNIKQYVVEPKKGQYDEQVRTLLEMDEQTGFENLIPILVPAEDANKHKRWFRESAKFYGKGARVVNGEAGVPQGDGGILFEFILTELRTVNRNPKPSTDESDVPTAA